MMEVRCQHSLSIVVGYKAYCFSQSILSMRIIVIAKMFSLTYSLQNVLALVIAIRTTSALPTDLKDSSRASAPPSLSKSSLSSRQLLDTRIQCETTCKVRTNAFLPAFDHTCSSQSSVCDRDRGATGYICYLYPKPDAFNPGEPFAHQPLYQLEDPNAHELGHCPDGSICVDIGDMIPAPDPRFPNQGTGPFAGCLDRSHIINIIQMLNYKQKEAAENVGVQTSVANIPDVVGDALDVIVSAGDDADRQADMEFIDIEIEGLMRNGGGRPGGYKTLGSRMCRYDPTKPREMLRSCRVDAVPKGADRVTVKAKTLFGGGPSGANGNIVVSNPHMELR